MEYRSTYEGLEPSTFRYLDRILRRRTRYHCASTLEVLR
jgi:hypothetical protein